MLTGGRSRDAPPSTMNLPSYDHSQQPVKHQQRMTPCMPCMSCHCAPLLMGPSGSTQSQRTESHTSSSCPDPMLPSIVNAQAVPSSPFRYRCGTAGWDALREAAGVYCSLRFPSTVTLSRCANSNQHRELDGSHAAKDYFGAATLLSIVATSLSTS